MDTKALHNRVDITQKDIADALRRPSSFGYGGDNDKMFVTWSLGPVIETRDSDILAQSNAAALTKHLESIPEIGEDWTITECSHWACGWVRHLSFRVLDDDGQPSLVFKVIRGWFDALSDYPVADEEDFSRREYEATLQGIKDNGAHVKDGAPENWPQKVFSWFWDGDQEVVSNGNYPDYNQLKECLKALGLLEEEEDE